MPMISTRSESSNSTSRQRQIMAAPARAGRPARSLRERRLQQRDLPGVAVGVIGVDPEPALGVIAPRLAVPAELSPVGLAHVLEELRRGLPGVAKRLERGLDR